MTAVHAANRSPDLGALTGQYREAHNRTDRECARSPWLLRSLRVLSTVGSDACRSCLTTLWPRLRSSGLHRPALPDSDFRNTASSNFSSNFVLETGSTGRVEFLVRLHAEVGGDDFLLDLGGAAEDRLDAAEPPELTIVAESGGWCSCRSRRAPPGQREPRRACGVIWAAITRHGIVSPRGNSPVRGVAPTTTPNQRPRISQPSTRTSTPVSSSRHSRHRSS